jgi:hypothetical protein
MSFMVPDTIANLVRKDYTLARASLGIIPLNLDPHGLDACSLEDGSDVEPRLLDG